MFTTALLGLLLVAVTTLVLLFLRLRKSDSEHRLVLQEHAEIKDRFRVVVDAEAEKQRVLGELETERTRLQTDIVRIRAEQQQGLHDSQEQRRRNEAELFNLQLSVSKLVEELKELDEEASLRSFGFYKPRYGFDSSERFQAALEEIRERQKRMIKDKAAAVCQIEWTVDGSRTEGVSKSIKHLSLCCAASTVSATLQLRR